MASIVLEVANLGQDARARRATSSPSAVSEMRPRPRSTRVGVQPGLELLDLHRERWLADRALLGRASEMAMPGEGREIAELAQGRHRMI